MENVFLFWIFVQLPVQFPIVHAYILVQLMKPAHKYTISEPLIPITVGLRRTEKGSILPWNVRHAEIQAFNTTLMRHAIKLLSLAKLGKLAQAIIAQEAVLYQNNAHLIGKYVSVVNVLIDALS